MHPYFRAICQDSPEVVRLAQNPCKQGLCTRSRILSTSRPSAPFIGVFRSECILTFALFVRIRQKSSGLHKTPANRAYARGHGFSALLGLPHRLSVFSASVIE